MRYGPARRRTRGWTRVAPLTLLLAGSLLAAGAPGVRADDGPAVKVGVEAIQEDINKAIDRGVLWLLQQQLVDGSWGQDAGRYPGGMTGLALYTLLKSGVALDHPCLALAFANLASIEPQQTYAVACYLLALGATGNPAHHPRMIELAERLLAWEVRGSWSYPWAHEGAGWADRSGTLDLSNTQFAVLGLRAAHEAGARIPPKVLHRVIRQTRFHQQIPREVAADASAPTPREAAGFAYHGPGQQGLGAATGSMTCAGITVLDVCRHLLGKRMSSKHERQIDDAIRHALTWIETNWSVADNPGQEKSHKLYYLYGLERVGSLLGIERIGDHAWYAEGAKELLAIQKDGGEWGSASETCFALLFLLRATKGEVTGEDRARSASPSYATREDSILRLRAEGHSPMAVWLTSVHPDAVARHGDRGHLQFEKVEYVVDGRVEATVAQGPPPLGADPTHRALLHFPRTGKYRVVARGHVDGPHGEVALESTPIEVEVKLIVPPWAPHEAAWSSRNLLTIETTEVEASTIHADHQGARKAVDGVTDSYWVCQSKPPDPRPTLEIRLAKPLKANALVLAPVARRDGGRTQWDRPKRIEVLLNGKGEPYVVAVDEDALRPAVLRLPQPTRIKSLTIAVPERTPGGAWPGEMGFREVTLEEDPVATPSLERDEEGRIVLACDTPGAVIHFTLDGTLPTRDAPRYVEPVAWPGRTRLHAVAFLPTGEASRPLVATVEVKGEVNFR